MKASEEWFQHYSFIKDPYEWIDPPRIDDRFLVWDRPDLEKTVRPELDRFKVDVIKGRRVGLKVFGPTGSGKTWLIRLLQKETQRGPPEIPYVYTKVPLMEPTFRVIYRIAIENFLQKTLERLVAPLEKRDLTKIDTWVDIAANEDLAHALMAWRQQHNISARQWLVGDRLSLSDLRALKISSSLDSDFDRFEMLKAIIKMTSSRFENVVLVVDELENARTGLAGQLGDGLRDLLDEYAGKFALICSYSAQRLEEWYDYGYSEALLSRLNYTAELASLRPESVVQFLRIHNASYRLKNVKIQDQIYPFTDSAAVKILTSMEPAKRYPRYYLGNCQFIARQAFEENQDITSEFVNSKEKELPFRR